MNFHLLLSWYLLLSGFVVSQYKQSFETSICSPLVDPKGGIL